MRGRLALLVVAAVFAVIVPMARADAQEYVRVDGTVHWLSGQTLVLVLDTPSGPPAYVIQGGYAVPVPAPRQTVSVDVSQLSQTEYSFMRSGERVAVIGIVSDDRRSLVAVSILRGPGLQTP